jgi:ketosteroid isomerase-like protein
MSDIEALRAAELSLQAAQLTSDVEALDRLLHPDLTFVGPYGDIGDKADDLEVHRTGAMTVEISEPEDLIVRVNDGVGVTVLTLHLKGAFRGQEFDSRMRYTRAWAWGDQGWRIVAAQALFLPTDAA